jgi:hypothetical protein
VENECYGERQVLFNLQCLIVLAKKKKCNLESQYNALHSNMYNDDFTLKSEIRKLKLKELQLKLTAQQQSMTNQVSKNATISFFKVSNLILKKCKPFTKGEFVKEYFIEGFKKKKEIIYYSRF